VFTGYKYSYRKANNIYLHGINFIFLNDFSNKYKYFLTLQKENIEKKVIMETKLTFSIEAGLAQTVKRYAKNNGYTLSTLVENYFLALIKHEEFNDSFVTEPLANTLLGSLKAPDQADYKAELANSLIKKYL